MNMKKVLFFLMILALCLTLTGCSVLGAVSGRRYDQADRYHAGSFTYAATDVRKVDINWVSGTVNLREADGETLSVTEDAAGLSTAQQMHWLLDGDTLRIQFCKSGYSGSIPGKKLVTVEIPREIALQASVTSGTVLMGSHTLQSLDAGCTSGSIEAGELQVSGELKAGCTSGSIHIGNTKAGSVSLGATSGSLTAALLDAGSDFSAGCTSGRITVEAVKADSVKAASTSGDMHLGLYQCGSAEIGATSGDIRLTIPAGQGVTVDFGTASGRLNGQKVQTHSERVVLGDGSCPVKVGTTSGSLTIEEK